MHTVFLNTSKNAIGGRVDVLAIEREYKQYTHIDCPLSAWYSPDNGFEKCALKIGEQIDIHKEITNDFNLVVYVDFLEMQEFFRRLFNADNCLIENAFYEVTKSLLARFFASTIYSELEKLGREPNEKMLLLIEQNQRRDVNASQNIDNDNLRSEMDKLKTDVVLKLFGLPAVDEMIEKAKALGDLKAFSASMAEIIDKNTGVIKGIDLKNLYEKNISIFLEDLSDPKNNIERVCYALADGIEKLYTSDCNNRVVISEFITDRRSANTNKEMDTKRNLCIQLFILDCIDSQTIYADEDGANKIAKSVPILSNADWKELATKLAKKKSICEHEEADITNITQSFTDMKLAPTLLRLPGEKFGLDESGNLAKKFSVKTKKKEKKKSDDDSPKPIGETTSELVEENGRKLNWFNSSEFECFDTIGSEFIDDVSGILSADEYCERATALANHHLNFMNKLNIHVSRVMSNYAGRSLSNAPAILRKRKVSVTDESVNKNPNDHKYTDGAKDPETMAVESVIQNSKRGYITILMEYLKFNSGRGVAMTSIKEQCEWCINRIRDIEASLKKLAWILGVLSITLAVLYVPFLMIQWDYIVKNVDTIFYAAVSLVVPFLLLSVGYGIARILQKRKMKKVWEELVEKSHRATEENEKTIFAYDSLLTMYIPALRWMYEYVLDVEFFQDCCRIAGAKLDHHRKKLHEMIETIGNILEDLECDTDYPRSIKDHSIDYTSAFCEGKNRDFYSIIDSEIIKIINKQRRTAE